MGVKIGDLISPQITDLKHLKGKKIAIDGLISLYQFLASIRGVDGQPLKDQQGRVTSHLAGLFYRTINLVEAGIRPVYVFDGRPPELKVETLQKRNEQRSVAKKQWDVAIADGRMEDARVYAQASAKVDQNIVQDAKMLLNTMNVPWVQGKGEGEAQAAYMAKQGDVWAAGSQDFDALLFGTPRLVRNLTITGRRKLPRKNEYVVIKPEVIDLSEMLQQLDVTFEQLIDIGILIGTDYHPGVKGVGPKTALKAIKKYNSIEPALSAGGFQVEIPYEEIRAIFQNIDQHVNSSYALNWAKPNREQVLELLVEQHAFSTDRVENALNRADNTLRTHHRGYSCGSCPPPWEARRGDSAPSPPGESGACCSGTPFDKHLFGSGEQ